MLDEVRLTWVRFTCRFSATVYFSGSNLPQHAFSRNLIARGLNADRPVMHHKIHFNLPLVDIATYSAQQRCTSMLLQYVHSITLTRVLLFS